jgi:hypothetical protein
MRLSAERTALPLQEVLREKCRFCATCFWETVVVS